MTVGVAALSERQTAPKIVLAADRMITTQQLSAIEHEHPETKIKQIGSAVPTVQALAIYAGNISWSEELHSMIANRCQEFLDEGETINMKLLAEISAEQYRRFIRERIQRQILDHYGLQLEDLSRQHQFKDQFINDILIEVENGQQTIKNNLTMLIGGVDQSNGYIYEVSGSDVTGHNDLGYAAIGSGHQPAKSTFMEAEYSSNADFDSAIANVTGSTIRARRASGVGGDIDIGVVTQQGPPQMADSDTVEKLVERHKMIFEVQDAVKQNLLGFHDVDWQSRGPP